MLGCNFYTAAEAASVCQVGIVCFARAAAGSQLRALCSLSIVKCSKQLKQPARAFSCLT